MNVRNCSGVAADLIWTLRGFGPQSKSGSAPSKSTGGYGHPSQIWIPPPPNFPWKKSFVSYLVTNSICKLFVDKDKEKQPFRSNSAAFIIASRTVYARIKCEQQNFVVEYEQWIPDFSSLHGE